MKKSLFYFSILLCLLISLAMPVLAMDVSCPDEIPGTHQARELTSGKTVTYSYTVPKDGAVVVICFPGDFSSSQDLFVGLNRFNWAKSSLVQIVAIESNDCTRAEVQAFIDTYAPDIRSRLQVYYGNSMIQWDYCSCVGSSMISWPMVAVITQEAGVPTIRYFDIRVNDPEQIYNILCQVSPAFAAANPPELGTLSGTFGDTAWSYDDTTGTLTISGKGAMPEEHSYGDGFPWDHLRKRIKKVVVQEGVTGLCYYTFEKMPLLTAATLPSTLENIPMGLFSQCAALSSVTLADGPTWLGSDAFSGCTALTSIRLPATLTYLGSGAFSDTSISSITIPASVETAHGSSLSEMPLLSNIYVVEGSAHYKSVDGVLYTLDGATLVRFPGGRGGSFTVPAGVQIIGADAFDGCQKLESVTLSDGVTTLDDAAFQDCSGLSELILPPSLTSIGRTAISDTAIKQLVVPASVVSVEDNAFYRNTNLSQLFFLGDAPLVGDYPLDNCADSVTVYYPTGAKDWESTWGGAPTKAVSYTITSTATCTKAGMHTITCKEPKLTYTCPAAALGHDMTLWTLVKAATETAEGQWNHGCTRCSYAEAVTIPKFLPAQDHAASTFNNDYQSYGYYFARNIISYLTPEADGTFTRVEAESANNGEIVIETYDKNLNFVSQKKLSYELPIFGGYYTDGNYRFLVFGQRNPEESNDVEVFRIVRYSLDWQRMDATSIYGANTYIPFDAGSLRCAHYGDYLHIRTAHEMYASRDGVHHQANVYLLIHIPTMTLMESVTGVGGNGYVSHSFNQLIAIDGKTVLTVDHGDAYPRSAVLHRYPVDADKPYIHDPAYTRPEEVDTLTYQGETGLNYTGATIGGFTYSDSHYLIAGTTADQSGNHNASHLQNIYVTATSKTDFSEDGTTFYWVTDYPADQELEISTPHLVKLSASRFLLLWTVDETLCYTFLDGTGKPSGKIYRTEGALSDCPPVVSGGKVIWYVTNGYEPEFYILDPGNPGTVTKKVMEHIHTFGEWYCWWKPTATEEGRESRICACGEDETRAVPPYNQWDNPFADIKSGKYYHGPVLWAYYSEITTGKTATTFLPDAPCTRAQIVTFLWRAMGQPEPDPMDNPFTDVAAGKYYYKAVLWAVQEGITTGKTATTFQPDAPCTRAQVVTFLWRAMGQPQPWNSYNPFWDVPENKYYTTAVLWAREEGITTGKTENTFLPDDTCTRAQIVTFLYRTMIDSARE